MIALHELRSSDAYPLSPNEICLRLRLSEKAEVTLWSRNKNQPADVWKSQKMEYMGWDGTTFFYETVVHTREKTRYLIYAFQLDASEKLWLCANGLADERPERGFYEYIYTQTSLLPSAPPWAQNALIYQIFPDRFARAGEDADGLTPWDAAPEVGSFFGGNLKGILSKVDYLQKLGVEAVYLNPVFLSVSNHRYDTTDYRRVDPLLGTEEDLIRLSDELHRHGIRLLLDGVFDHCGEAYPPFQDVVEKGEASPWAEWFMVDRFPVSFQPPSYEAIGYYRAMPKFRLSNPEVQEELIQAARYWTRVLKLDGWRLDVADELEPSFLRRLGEELREENPEVFLLGEAWQENPDLVGPGQAHGLVDYPFQRAITDFFALNRIDPKTFAQRVWRSLLAYPRHARQTNLRMLDCHDVPRFWTLCGKKKKRLECALCLLALFPGNALIYYGDEAGLEGGPDPDCRRAMPWGKENIEVMECYRRFVEWKKRIRGGDFTFLTEAFPLTAARSVRGDGVFTAVINMTGETLRYPLPPGEISFLFCETACVRDGYLTLRPEDCALFQHSTVAK